MDHGIIFQFIGNSLFVFITGYGVGITFYAIRQFVNRAARP